MEIRQTAPDFHIPTAPAAVVIQTQLSNYSPAPRVGEDEKVARAAVGSQAFPVPPEGDGMSGEGGGIVGNPDHERAAIVGDVVVS
ncbi:MAG TPA: hypothetical protein VE994_10070 [Terriglobales bacterium]|nr:hypothetical protein [Terriglobales bacterium]